MEYGLLPAIVSIAFLVLLLLIYTRKQQYKTMTTTIYKLYIYTTIAYAFFQVLAIMYVSNISDGILFIILWRIMFMLFILSIYLIFLYGYTTIYKTEEDKFKDIINKNKTIKIITILFAILIMIFLIPIKVNLIDFANSNNIVYMDTLIGLLLILVVTVLSLHFASVTYEHKDELSKPFKTCYKVALPLFIACLAGQIWYTKSTIPITVLMYIVYLIYYLIENPDILYLKEKKRIETGFEKENNHQLGLFDMIDESIVNPSFEILYLTKKLNNPNISTEEKNKILNEIIKKNKEYLDILNRIFVESQIKEEKRNDREYDFTKILSSFENYFEKNKQNSKITFDMKISSNIPRKLYGDFENIYNTVVSILKYSCKRTSVGKIALEINSEKISDGIKLIFKISDTSEGTLDLSIEKQSDIDLKLSEAYVKILKGKISYSNTRYLGNEFIIEIEQKVLDKNDLANIESIHSENNTSIKEIYTNKKALIVDDNKQTLNLTKKILSKYNIESETTESGNECINKVKSEEKFDIIFLDIMMSEISGIDVIHSLKELQAYGYALPPVIALTANALPGMKEKYIKEGFDDYISKPIFTKDLENILKKHLK